MEKRRTFKALLVKRHKDSEGLIFERLEIDRENALAEYYKALNCKLIDIQERYINGTLYDFIIDDEYLLTHERDNKKIVAVGTRSGQIVEAIYEGLIICGTADRDGDETDLTESKLINILKYGRGGLTAKDKSHHLEVISYTFENEGRIQDLKTSKA